MPTLSIYARSLGADDAMVGIIVGAYGLTQLILRIPLGILSDRLGRRKVFTLLGFVAIIVSSVGMVLAPNPTWLFLFRALAGVAASSWVATTVMFAGLFPPQQAVRSTSIMSVTSAVGQMVATFAGGYIANAVGVDSPFWVSAMVAFLGMALLAPGAERTGSRRTPPSLSQVLRVLVHPVLLIVSLVAALGQFTVFSTSYAFVPIYADEVLGLSATHLGALTSVVLIPNAIMAALVASLSTRVRESHLVSAGLTTMALATFAIPFIGDFWTLLLSRIVFGVGLGLSYPVLMGLSIKTVAQEERASAMGAFQAIYALGMTVGPAISGFISREAGLNAVFWVSALACLVGLSLVLMGPGREHR